MRKTVYILCLCLLSTLVYCEMKYDIIGEKEGVYVPTSALVSQVKEENAGAGGNCKGDRERGKCGGNTHLLSREG